MERLGMRNESYSTFPTTECFYGESASLGSICSALVSSLLSSLPSLSSLHLFLLFLLPYQSTIVLILLSTCYSQLFPSHLLLYFLVSLYFFFVYRLFEMSKLPIARREKDTITEGDCVVSSFYLSLHSSPRSPSTPLEIPLTTQN